MASDYTRGLSLQAIKLVFENLEHSYHFGDEESREKMHNASTMAICMKSMTPLDQNTRRTTTK